MVNPAADVLFTGAGVGASPVFYYRCMLPATVLNASYQSYIGIWPRVRWTTGLIQDREGGPPSSKIAAWENYKIIVLQQPRGDGWLDLIKALRTNGAIVIYEVDDYLHGIKEKRDHDFRAYFKTKHLESYVRCMRACDAMIVSTDFIAEKYARYNNNIHVCYNGLDTGRYSLTRPTRSTVNIGWSGATGHFEAMRPWLQKVANVMGANPHTCFISIGQPFANAFKDAFAERSLSVPFAAVEQYPGAMTMFDIALAPAGTGSWYRGKSDLRFLEAGALGIPVIADPLVYPNIVHRENGMLASTPTQLESMLHELVNDQQLRERLGAAAKEYVHRERAINVLAHQWLDVFNKVAGYA